MVILGIDPGYATVGFGVISQEGSKLKAIDYGVISTSKDENLSTRLFKISESLDTIMDKYSPDVIAIEELFFQNNQKTAILVAEARGAILLTLYKKNKKLYEYTPLQIKQAMTGYGRAEKSQIQHMVTLLLNLKEIPKPDDAADALAVALTHAQSGRFSTLFGV